MSVPAAYLGVIIIWSTTPLAIKWSSDGGDFLFGLVSRMAVGLAVCLIVMQLLRVKMPWRRDARRTYLIAGTGLYGAMMCVYWGAQFIPSGLIAVLFGLTPAVTAIMAATWLNERSLTPVKIIGLISGIGGLAFIFADKTHLGSLASYGIAAVLVAAVLHSGSAVAIKRIGTQLPAMATTAGALMVATPLYLLTWLSFGSAPPAAVSTRSMLAIVYLGVFGSALGFILYFYALKHVEASRIALIPMITPVLALLMGLLLNHERIATSVWVGTALILTGLLFIEGEELLGRFARAEKSRA